MTRRRRISDSKTAWTRVVLGMGLAGACTVVDKGDYTFTDNPEDSGGEGGTGGKGGAAGSSSGAAGKGGGASGDAGDGSGAVGGTGGTGGTGGSSGEAGGGSGGEGGLCDPNPCQHGGVCTSDGVKADCDCADGYEGLMCEDEIDECDPNPCAHGERCTDLVADFKCDCMPIDAGKRCELPRFQPIGPPSGQGAVVARAVSADGRVVVGHLTDGMGFAKPFIWTVEAATRGPMPLPIPISLRPDLNVYATAVSGDGTRWAGYYQGTSAMDFPRPLGGTLTMSAELATPSGGRGGNPFDIDATGGKVVGVFFDSTNTFSHAGQWTSPASPVTPLPNPLGMNLAAAAGAVTRDGAIVTGTAKDNAGGVLVVSWVDDPDVTAPPTRRFSMMGVTNADVHGLSSDGMLAVGTILDTANANFAFATENGNAINVAPMNGAVFAHSNAWDTSDDGNVTVGDVLLPMSGTTVAQACIWTRNQGITSYKGTVVDALRSTNVILPNGWQLTAAYGVSADGKTLVGSAVDPQGIPAGYVARLP